MELEGRCFMMDAFSITTIHPAIWDPWSMETNFVIGKNRSPSHRRASNAFAEPTASACPAASVSCCVYLGAQHR